VSPRPPWIAVNLIAPVSRGRSLETGRSLSWTGCSR